MTQVKKNVAQTAFQQTTIWLEGGWGAIRTAGVGLNSLLGRGTFQERLAETRTQRFVFSSLRAFLPNVTSARKLIKAYDNIGTKIVTRRAAVLEVLSRDLDFEVVYGPRMRKLTDGDNFFLGMQPGPDYERDVSAMRLAARRRC